VDVFFQDAMELKKEGKIPSFIKQALALLYKQQLVRKTDQQ